MLIVAILITIGLGLAGVTLLQDAIAHGDSLLVPAAILAIPLWLIGLAVVAGIARIVPRLRVGHDRARGVLSVVIAVLLGVGIYGVNAGIPTQRPEATITDAIASACVGQPIPLAGHVHADGSTQNHLVVLDAVGAESSWTGKAPLEWRPPSVDDVELVACVSEESESVVEACPYEGGSTITRLSTTRQVRVVAVRSGLELARFSITEQPRECPFAKVGDDDSELTGVVSWESVAAHLASFVRDGTFVDPDAPLSSAEPGTSADPVAEPKGTDLQDAIADGLVTAKGRGAGLQSLELRITSKTTEPLHVVVTAGTYLDPGKKATQTMVVITSTTIDIDPGETVTESLDVACAQMPDDQPGDSDTFNVRRTVAAGDLRKLLAADSFAAADFRIQQFAIWTVTNDPTASGYVGIGSYGFGSGPDKAELREIKAMFRDAGIDPTDYRALD